MKVERSTIEQVKERFEFNKKKKLEVKKQYGRPLVWSVCVTVCHVSCTLVNRL